VPGTPSVEELCERLAQRDGLIDALRVELGAARVRIAELEARLGQSSRNSSRPPSSDGLAVEACAASRRCSRPRVRTDDAASTSGYSAPATTHLGHASRPDAGAPLPATGRYRAEHGWKQSRLCISPGRLCLEASGGVRVPGGPCGLQNRFRDLRDEMTRPNPRIKIALQRVPSGASGALHLVEAKSALSWPAVRHVRGYRAATAQPTKRALSPVTR